MADILATLIWTCVLGLAVGNYATSFVYRMPKRESPFTKHPYCGGCGTMLQTKDLFPAVSWLLLRGKCRYCAMEIPSVYFWTEVFCAAIFMAGALSLGYSEAYILVVVAGTCLVTLWALEFRVQQVFYSLLVLIAAIGVISRVLQDDTIYPAMYGIFWGAGLPMVWWRIRQDRANLNGEKERLALPASVAFGATAGAWLAPLGLAVFAVFWLAAIGVYRVLAVRFSCLPAANQTAPFAFVLAVFMVWPGIVPQVQTLLTSLFVTAM